MKDHLKILVFEAASAGLFKADLSVLSEGLTMLSALTKDLIKAGCEASVVLNKSLSSCFNVKTKVFKVEGFKFSFLKRLAEKHDFTYVIAPETSNMLLKTLKELDGFHLNSKPEAVKQASNKKTLAAELKKQNLKTPKIFIQEDFKDLRFPLIVKPCLSAGCEGLKIVKNLKELKKALKLFKNNVIIQEFIKGVPASVSLISNGFKAESLALNRQFIRLDKPEYLGGFTPLNHKLKLKALKTAEKAVEAFKGLKGYIGVDLILSGEEVYVTEVNPRLTVSYAGLSKASKVNLAKLILDSSLERIIKPNLSFKNACFFRKTLFKNLTKRFIMEATRLKEFLTPPVSRFNEGYSFIVVMANNIFEAERKYLNLIKSLSKEVKAVYK
ncbi:ATP-grasp domain-containing protein [Candidatus Bathyarchaeota archaeon]|nr:ATP-grasp domain-containing protein [Candidatus Bathyarchaeota archaeon]